MSKPFRSSVKWRTVRCGWQAESMKFPDEESAIRWVVEVVADLHGARVGHCEISVIAFGHVVLAGYGTPSEVVRMVVKSERLAAPTAVQGASKGSGA